MSIQEIQYTLENRCPECHNIIDDNILDHTKSCPHRIKELCLEIEKGLKEIREDNEKLRSFIEEKNNPNL